MNTMSQLLVRSPRQLYSTGQSSKPRRQRPELRSPVKYKGQWFMKCGRPILLARKAAGLLALASLPIVGCMESTINVTEGNAIVEAKGPSLLYGMTYMVEEAGASMVEACNATSPEAEKREGVQTAETKSQEIFQNPKTMASLPELVELSKGIIDQLPSNSVKLVKLCAWANSQNNSGGGQTETK